MEIGPGLLPGLAFALALLVVLRWIAGGGRRHAPGPRRSRPAPPDGAWNHVGARRRDLAASGSREARLR